MRAGVFISLLLGANLACGGGSNVGSEPSPSLTQPLRPAIEPALETGLTPVPTQTQNARITPTVSNPTSAVPTQTAVPVTTPITPSSGHPRGTLTGIPQVDDALRRVYAGQSETLAADRVLTEIQCTNTGLGGPSCPPGVASGSLTQTFFLSTCAIHYETSMDVLQQQLPAFNVNDLALVGVYEPVKDRPFHPAFAVVFFTQNGPLRTLFLDQAGKLAGILLCNDSFPTSGGKILFDAPK